MTEKKAPVDPSPEASEERPTKPYDPHVFHPEKFRGTGVIAPATGDGHNHTPGAIPLSPETHDPGE
jgi:hypothetical protein